MGDELPFAPGDAATPPVKPFPGIHVALIMDGNGRWALARHRPRTFGHRAGVKAVRSVVRGSPGLGLGVLTLYAFSSDNWRRPAPEVRELMRLFRRYLLAEADELGQEGVRLQVIGRRDRLSQPVREAISYAEGETRGGERLLLRVAVDYSARDTIVEAASRAPRCPDGRQRLERADMARLMGEALHEPGPVPDVDLLVRTGGERRLSDFLLWECAYAELYFTDVMWPDFRAEELARAVNEFRARVRRFGQVEERASSAG